MPAYNTLQDFLDTLPSDADPQTEVDSRYVGPGVRHIVRWLDINDDRYIDRTTYVLESGSPALFYVASGFDTVAHAEERRLILNYALGLQGTTFVKVLAEIEWVAETEVMLIKAATNPGSGIEVRKYLVARNPVSNAIVHFQVPDDFRILSYPCAPS